MGRASYSPTVQCNIFSYSIDFKTFQALSTRAGGEVIGGGW